MVPVCLRHCVRTEETLSECVRPDWNPRWVCIVEMCSALLNTQRPSLVGQPSLLGSGSEWQSLPVVQVWEFMNNWLQCANLTSAVSSSRLFTARGCAFARTAYLRDYLSPVPVLYITVLGLCALGIVGPIPSECAQPTWPSFSVYTSVFFVIIFLFFLNFCLFNPSSSSHVSRSKPMQGSRTD